MRAKNLLIFLVLPLCSWGQDDAHGNRHPLFQSDEILKAVLTAPIAQTYAGSKAFFAAYRSDPIIFYDDDPVSSVAVKRRIGRDGDIDTALVVNGKGDGSLVHDFVTMSLAAVIPALLAEKLERAFVIGWGTGISAGELAGLESTREVVVAEISPAVVRAAPFFAGGNRDAANSPKVRIVIGDAYRTLLRSHGPFDVIVSEPSNPWVLGVEMLYSREFLEAARDRLTPGGVHLQWMHLYEIDDETQLRVYNASILGYMFRTQELPAAFARAQLQRLDENNAIRHKNCAVLTEVLSEYEWVTTPYVPEDRTHVWWMYIVRFDPKKAGVDLSPLEFRTALEKALHVEGVAVGQWQIMPVPAQDLFQTKLGHGKGFPWKNNPLYDKEVTYRGEDYPVATALCEDYTAIIGTNPPNGGELMEMYAEAFRKVLGDLDAVVKHKDDDIVAHFSGDVFMAA